MVHSSSFGNRFGTVGLGHNQYLQTALQTTTKYYSIPDCFSYMNIVILYHDVSIYHLKEWKKNDKLLNLQHYFLSESQLSRGFSYSTIKTKQTPTCKQPCVRQYL